MPMDITADKMRELGGGDQHALAVMRYVHGVITRERERIAMILTDSGKPELAQLASKIRNEVLDPHVFRWAPASDSLQSPIKSDAEKREAREKEKAAKKK